MGCCKNKYDAKTVPINCISNVVNVLLSLELKLENCEVRMVMLCVLFGCEYGTILSDVRTVQSSLK